MAKGALELVADITSVLVEARLVELEDVGIEAGDDRLELKLD